MQNLWALLATSLPPPSDTKNANSMTDNRERIRGPSRDGRDGLTSPRQVLRRLMLLTEGRQFREAAGMIGRLGPSVFRSVVAELPLDILVDALPHSAYLLETFFCRWVGMKKVELGIKIIIMFSVLMQIKRHYCYSATWNFCRNSYMDSGQTVWKSPRIRTAATVHKVDPVHCYLATRTTWTVASAQTRTRPGGSRYFYFIL